MSKYQFEKIFVPEYWKQAAIEVYLMMPPASIIYSNAEFGVWSFQALMDAIENGVSISKLKEGIMSKLKDFVKNPARTLLPHTFYIMDKIHYLDQGVEVPDSEVRFFAKEASRMAKEIAIEGVSVVLFVESVVSIARKVMSSAGASAGGTSLKNSTYFDAAICGDDAAKAVGKSAGKFVSNLDELFSNPRKLGNATPEEWYNYLKDNNFNPQPLNDGTLKGIPFSDGGGFKVNWGGDRILQYHPSGGRHHLGTAYWKLSSGPTGTLRFDIWGNAIQN